MRKTKHWMILVVVLGLGLNSNAHADVIVGLPAATGTGNCIPFGCPNLFQLTTFQEVYASSSFSGPLSITDISFFLTQVLDRGTTITAADYVFSLSTTSATVGNLDASNLSNNIGPDNQTFFSGMLSGPIVGGEFTVTGSPFAYNPVNGNLLLTVNISGAGPDSQAFLDFDGTGIATERVYAPGGGGPGGPGPGLVTGFSTASVPQPGTLALLGSGIVTLATVSLRLRKRLPRR